MTDNLRHALQEEFADVYTIVDLAIVFAEIQLECQAQLYNTAEQIKKEVLDNE